MKAVKRITCFVLAFAMCFCNNSWLSLQGLDFLKPIRVFAETTATDGYKAYKELHDSLVTTEEATQKLNVNVQTKKTRVDSADGNKQSGEMRDYWKIKDSLYKNGIYNGYFTYQQKDVDAAAQVKSGDWLNKNKYEAMSGTPTTDNLFMTFGGSQWIVDLQYRIVECSYIRKYEFNAGVLNYRYYKKDDPSGKSGVYQLPKTMFSGDKGTKYDQHPQDYTLMNFAWAAKERDTKKCCTNTEGDFFNKITIGGKNFKFWKKDEFDTSRRFGMKDDPDDTSLTPNQSLVLAIKNQVCQIVEQYQTTYKTIDDNYRGDQGVSNIDFENLHPDLLAFMYTYQGMVRRSDNASRVNGPYTEAENPAFISYLYDWDAYIKMNQMDTSYPSDIASYYKLSEYPGLSFSDGQIWKYLTGEDLSSKVGSLFPMKSNDGIFDNVIQSEGHEPVRQVWLGNQTAATTYIQMLWQKTQDDSVTKAWCKNPSKMYAFAGKCKSKSFALTSKELGAAVESTFEIAPGVTINLNTDSWCEIGSWYYCALYSLYIRYAWMFYNDEINQLWGNLQGCTPSGSNTVSLVNKRLGIVFSDGCQDASQFSEAASTAQFSIRIPYAIFPRGGDLDGGMSGSAENYGSNVYDYHWNAYLFQGTKETKNVYWDEYRIQCSSNTYSYPNNIYCIKKHADGTHCTLATSGLYGKECKEPGVHQDCVKATKLDDQIIEYGCPGWDTPAKYPNKVINHRYTNGCIDEYHVGAVEYKTSSSEHKRTVPSDDPEDTEDKEESHTDITVTLMYPNGIKYEPHHGDHHSHYEDTADHMIVKDGNPAGHGDRFWEEEFIFSWGLTASNHTGNFVKAPKEMGDHQIIGQRFNNVQWLDIDSYQVWMLNKGYSKGLAKLLAEPVTIDTNFCTIMQTEVTNQLGYNILDIDDDKLHGANIVEPSNGLSKIGKVGNLQQAGRVANSLWKQSQGNYKSTTFLKEKSVRNGNTWGGTLASADILSYWVNDVPAILNSYSLPTDSARGDIGYINGDFHAYIFDESESTPDHVVFRYNPYVQGGRSHSTFKGFINQALAHTLYYCCTSNAATADPKPKPNSNKVSYSNSIRIQGDYIGLDNVKNAGGKYEQQPLAGYMYDTWREHERDTKYNGYQFRLVQDPENEGNYKLSKFNCRCAWIPADLPYILGRVSVGDIYMSKIITSKSNCWIIHTFCQGFNDKVHSCWDQISNDGLCTLFSATMMGDVRNNQHEDDVIQLKTMLLHNHQGNYNIINLKYFNGKKPYDLISQAFRTADSYSKCDDKYYNIYAAKSTKAPWVGYGADGYASGGSLEGFKDITKRKTTNTQLGYLPLDNNYKFDTKKTYVDGAFNGGFKQFGAKIVVKPEYKNTDKKDRGAKADNADAFSKYYPWLQHLNVNRYLANDRYKTGRAALEYVSVGKKTDEHLNAIPNVHTKSENITTKLNKYFYKNSIKYFDEDWAYSKTNKVYVPACYRTLTMGHPDGNPNDIVIYNPVSSQSAHIVPLSEYLPDGGNTGTNGQKKRSYTTAYLDAFLTYVVRDTRLAYKYTLDNAADNKSEQFISDKDIFKQSIITTTITTVDEVNDESDINTTYYTMSDYDLTTSEGYVKSFANFTGYLDIDSSDTYNMTLYKTAISNISGSIHLNEGDNITFDPNTNAVILNMDNAGLFVKWDSFVKAYKLLQMTNYCTNEVTSAKGSQLVDKVGDFGIFQSPNFSTCFTSFVHSYINNQVYTDAGMNSAFADNFDTFLSGLNVSTNTTKYNQVLNAAKDLLKELIHECKADRDCSKDIPLTTDSVLAVNLSGLTLRAGQLVHLSFKMDTPNSLELNMPKSKDIEYHAVWKDNVLNVYMEALADTSLDNVTLNVTQDCKMFHLDNALTCDASVLMCLGDSETVITNVTSYDYWYSSEAYSSTTAHSATFINTRLMIRINEVVKAALGFHISHGGSVSDVVLKSESIDDPHKVPNSNWKYYVLGWYTTDEHRIVDINDPVLQDSTTRLKVPSGTAYIESGYITVGELKSKAAIGSLGIYKDWSGNYGLIDLKFANGVKTYEHYSRYTGYETVDCHFPTISFNTEDSVTPIYDEVKPVSFFRNSSISQYAYEAVFQATTTDGLCYDVRFSKNPAHKVTLDSENEVYEKDWHTVTISEPAFTAEAYNDVFGNAVSLDDEFTIYWDNYTDLTKESKSGKIKNLKAPVTDLGKGWDNRANSQANKGAGSDKNVPIYSKWNEVKKTDYWSKLQSLNSVGNTAVTDTTKWLYNKYLIFNVDMYAFSPDKSYTYDDKKGPNGQDGTWDPTTPAYKANGTPNKIVYIPAGSKVYLGYYLQRDTDDVIGVSDNSGRFVDYGYNFYIDSNGNRHDETNSKPTRDPNQDLYTYHFWCPLSDGESYENATVQFIANGINSVDDMDEDANKDHVVDNRKACTDGASSISRTIGTTMSSKSKGSDTSYVKKLTITSLARYNQNVAKSCSIDAGIGNNEWGTQYLQADGITKLNNAEGIARSHYKKKTLIHDGSAVFRRYVNSINSTKFSIVGRVGNFTVEDVGDPRYQDSFKVAAPDAPFAISPFIRAVTVYSNKQGEVGSQYRYMTDIADARGRLIFPETAYDKGDAFESSYKLAKSGDTYANAAWYLSASNMSNHYALNDWSGLNKHEEILNDLQTVKVGYELMCSLETIGNYYGSLAQRPNTDEKDYVNANMDYGQTKVQIHPMYVAYNTVTKETVPVDAYMRTGNTYTCINAGSMYASKDQVEEGDDDKGPYYLTTTYKNPYAIGMETNTAGNDGNTYLLDQNMLRRSITEPEAKITYNVMKDLAPNKGVKEVTDGVNQSILEYFDYSDKNNIGGLALDDTYVYGNAQMLFLREYNRTFIGGTTLALNQKNSDLSSFASSTLYNSQLYAQKWYFGLSLPSSTVFVGHGKRVKESTILTADKHWYIICLVEIYVIGEKWALTYNTRLSEAGIKIEDHLIPHEKWNVYKKKFPKAFPVCIYNLSKANSAIDLDTRGSH